MNEFITLVLINYTFSFFNFYYAGRLGRRKITWFFISLLMGGPIATIMLWVSNKMYVA